ncbi:hypothetical protein Ahia01_000936600 [Argonauta hians]
MSPSRIQVNGRGNQNKTKKSKMKWTNIRIATATILCFMVYYIYLELKLIKYSDKSGDSTKNLQNYSIKTTKKESIYNKKKHRRDKANSFTEDRSFNCSNDFKKQNIKVRRRNSLYQILMKEKNEIYLYKAYYDDRESHWGKKYIHVLAIGPPIHKTIYADLWFENNDSHRTVTFCSVTKHGRDSVIDSKVYCQYFFMCEVTSKYIPEYVSLYFNECNIRTNLLKINVPEKKRKHKFAICVETGYGHIDPVVILQFVEYNKLMGVSSISVYPCNVSNNNLNIFRYYEKEGIMQVYLTPSPLQGTAWIKQTLSSPISFNDCMLRQMYSAEYIIPIDFDEILVPQMNATNYSELLKEINFLHATKEPFASYSFKTFIFFTTCGTTISSKFSNIYRFVYRLKSTGHFKSIIDPRKCLSVFNHYCRVNFKRIKGVGHLTVSTSIGAVNHYRRSWSKRFCKFLKRDNTKDTLCKDKFGNMLRESYNYKYNQLKKLKLIK